MSHRLRHCRSLLRLFVLGGPPLVSLSHQLQNLFVHDVCLSLVHGLPLLELLLGEGRLALGLVRHALSSSHYLSLHLLVV